MLSDASRGPRASGGREAGGGHGGLEGAVMLSDAPRTWVRLLGAGPVACFRRSPVAFRPRPERGDDFGV